MRQYRRRRWRRQRQRQPKLRACGALIILIHTSARLVKYGLLLLRALGLARLDSALLSRTVALTDCALHLLQPSTVQAHPLQLERSLGYDAFPSRSPTHDLALCYSICICLCVAVTHIFFCTAVACLSALLSLL